MTRLIPLMVIAIGFAAGCGSGSNAPPTYAVTGTVTFDGAPLKSGDIRFEPETPGEAPDAGTIADGKFSIRAKAGKKKVRITASREIPGTKTKGAMGEDLAQQEQYIPDRYNANTELTETVKNGSNTFTFALQSAAK